MSLGSSFDILIQGIVGVSADHVVSGNACWERIWCLIKGRVKLEDEAFDFRESMTEIERLSKFIEWIDLSFGERERTPEWAIQVGIRRHLAGMSTRDVSQFLDELGVQRSHVAVHNWVQKAHPQPASTVSADHLAVDEKVIPANGDDYWLYGVVDPETCLGRKSRGW